MLTPMGGAAFAAAVEDFRVELNKLRSTAGELQGEVEALFGAAEELTGNPEFGDEKIVGALYIGTYHKKIMPVWQQFVADLQGGVATGETALQEVATRYETVDTESGRRMDRIGEDTMGDHGIRDDKTKG